MTIRPLLIPLLSLAWLLAGCPTTDPVDDDTMADDDTGDDDAGDDDDTVPPPDACDDYPSEIICDVDTAITCDPYGDIESTEDCDVANDFYCWWGLGCVMCYPDERWCDGDDVVQCAADGQSTSVVETCDVNAGFVCEGGYCLSRCEQAESQRSSIGCLYYGVDMEQFTDSLLYAIVVSNVDAVISAEVIVETKSGNTWSVVDSGTVAPLDLHVFQLPDRHLTQTALGAGMAYRVTSQIPVIAYQFNPLEGDACSSDASLLLPASAYDEAYVVDSWGSGAGYSEFNVVAEADGTQVTFTPTVSTSSGSGVPGGTPGVPVGPITLDEGDVLQVAASSTNSSLVGTTIETVGEVGVFMGNTCANVPSNISFCDHIEEQLYGLQTWGTEYLAARNPPVSSPPEEPAWHILAGDAATVLTFEAEPEVTGLPPGGTLTLGPGESHEMYVTGSTGQPGDFYVYGTEAFLVTQFMRSGSGGNTTGDPCMVQAVPVEQFLDSYVVLVPTTWIYDRMTITRTPGETVTVNGTDVNNWPNTVTFTDVLGLFEVVRLDVPDDTYLVEGSEPFGINIAGYDYADSYCYPGGLNQEIINDL